MLSPRFYRQMQNSANSINRPLLSWFANKLAIEKSQLTRGHVLCDDVICFCSCCGRPLLHPKNHPSIPRAIKSHSSLHKDCILLFVKWKYSQKLSLNTAESHSLVTAHKMRTVQEVMIHQWSTRGKPSLVKFQMVKTAEKVIDWLKQRKE